MENPERVLTASELEADCLGSIDEVAVTGQAITITRHGGHPVVRLVAVVDDAGPLFGRLRGWITKEADIVTPIDVSWE
jgi:antitoxin (DNA-binding transcriptional repressor) of toxin-antitoxin stability system